MDVAQTMAAPSSKFAKLKIDLFFCKGVIIENNRSTIP
jgi:hypothetical protein